MLYSEQVMSETQSHVTLVSTKMLSTCTRLKPKHSKWQIYSISTINRKQKYDIHHVIVIKIVKSF